MKEKDKEGGLFKDFPPVPTDKWEEQIAKDLKGADYEKRLVRNTEDGIRIKPYYRHEDLEGVSFVDTLPGDYPFVRGIRTKNNDWEVRQDINTDDISIANAIAVSAAERGVEGIGFNAKRVESENDLSDLLRYIDIENTSVHFISAREYPYISELFIKEIDLRGADRLKVKGSLGFDPWNYFLLHGNFYNSMNDNINEASYLISKIRDVLPNYKVINVSGDVFHNAGATIAQELAYSLASGHEYVVKLVDSGLSVDKVSSAMQFTFAIGSDYFMEIAKLRAARLLWSTIIDQYNPKNRGSAAMIIHGKTSLWNKTMYDPNVNILRATTETMAGAIGGCNSFTVNPYDITFKASDAFSMRLARNTQIILKEEAYFGDVADPAAGSYFIENLTDSIADAAWKIFKEIESEGGFLEFAGKGKIKEHIERSAQEKKLKIAKRKTVVLGTNQYPNSDEMILGKVTPVNLKRYQGLTLLRGTMDFENLRLSTEKYVSLGNERPKVLLVGIGDLTMQKARSGFASNFFGCAGYNIIEHSNTKSIEDAVDAALNSNASIVVICSSDDEYGSLGIDLTKELKSKNKDISVVIAGNPKPIIDKLTEAGVDGFIHVRSNILETLQYYNSKLGIIESSKS